MNNELYFEIINNDSLIELKKLKDNSIDCVITDPPYFLHKLDNDWSDQNIEDELKYKLNSHIKHLPKGMKFDKKQVKQLYDYYLELSELLFDKSKPDGAMRKLMDGSTLRALGYVASTSLRSGLELAYANFLQNVLKLRM